MKSLGPEGDETHGDTNATATATTTTGQGAGGALDPMVTQIARAKTVGELASLLGVARFLDGGKPGVIYQAAIKAAHANHGNGFVRTALSVSQTPQASAQGIDGEIYARFAGHAFIKGKGDAQAIAPNDVEQGALSDCWLLAAMIAVARASPDAIRDLIHDRGDGTYEVTLYVGDAHPVNGTVQRTAKKFIVDSAFPVGTKGARRYARSTDHGNKPMDIELWPMLIEKAYAKHMGAYVGMAYFGAGLDARFESAIEELLPTGQMQSTPTSTLTAATATTLLSKARQTNRPVTMMTPLSLKALHPTLAKKWHLQEWHHYALRSVSVDDQTLSLDNPWGKDHVVDLPMADFLKCFAHVQIGPPLSRAAPDAVPATKNLG